MLIKQKRMSQCFSSGRQNPTLLHAAPQLLGRPDMLARHKPQSGPYHTYRQTTCCGCVMRRVAIRLKMALEPFGCDPARRSPLLRHISFSMPWNLPSCPDCSNVKCECDYWEGSLRTVADSAAKPEIASAFTEQPPTSVL